MTSKKYNPDVIIVVTSITLRTDMFEQFSNSIKATLYDRISSPLSSSFLVSWCLWNYKILIVLFSSIKPYDKYNQIEILISTTIFKTPFYEPLGYWLSNGIVFPALSALAYIYLYPVPSKIIYEHHLKTQDALKSLRNKIENEERLSVKDSLKIKNDWFGKEKVYIDLINSKDIDIKTKEATIESLHIVYNNQKDETNKLNERLSTLNENIASKLQELEDTQLEFIKVNNENLEHERQISLITTQLNDSQELNIRLSNGFNLSFYKASKIISLFDNTLEFDVFQAICKNFNSEEKPPITIKDIFNLFIKKNVPHTDIDAAISKLKNSSYIFISTSEKLTLTSDGKIIAKECGLA